MLFLSIFLLSYSYNSVNIELFMYDEDKSKTLEVEELQTALSKLSYCRFEVTSDLYSLQIIGNNDDLYLPENLYLLKKMNLFYCTNSGLSKLPKKFSELKEVKYLNLSENKFKNIPEEIFSLTQLECLNFSENCLENISDKILNLENLKYLNVEKNNLSEINKNIFKIKTLEQGIFQGNNLEYLPKEFTAGYDKIIIFDTTYLRPVANSDYLGFFDLPEKYLRNVDRLDLYCINNTFNTPELYRFIETGNIRWNLNEVLSVKPEELKKHQKDFDYLAEIWRTYLLPNIEEEDLKEVWKYVKGIYNTPDSDIYVMDLNFEAGKELIKDYMENVFDILKQRVINGSKDIVSIVFMLIRDGIYKCFDGQLEAWHIAFTSLNNDYNEDLTIEKFIKNTLAKIKENILKKITTSNSNIENIHIFSHWKHVLQNELGFASSTKLYGNYPHLKIYESKGYILYKFFKEFRPKNVIEEILEIINKNNTMLSNIAKKIFKDNESNLSAIESFFEYEDDIKYQLIHKITFDGLLYILNDLNLIIFISENTDMLRQCSILAKKYFTI